MRNRIILILAILSAVLFISTLSSCRNLIRQKTIRDKEMALRLDLEEKMNKFSQERFALLESLKAKEKELEEEKDNHERTKKALAQEQLVNMGLREEIQKVKR
jgi:ATP-dependent Lon protease